MCFLLSSSFVFAKSRLAHEEKILICGVCKNVEAALDSTIKNIEELGSRFKDYQVIIYENNSTDKTVEILRRWASENRHVLILSEQLSQEDFKKMGARCLSYDGKPSRMELIARARNIVLEQARSPQYHDFRYLLMADLDFKDVWPIREILKTVRSKRKWDCVSANGIGPEGFYYDHFALRDAKHPLGPELIGQSWWYGAPNKLKLQKKRWHSVYSAFGGLAIYKRVKILACSYSGACTEDLKKDYTNILSNISEDSYYLQKFRQQFGNGPIQFQNNSGYYEFPVCCEHVTLHASMRLKGYSRMYINPNMIMHYN